MRCVVSGFGRRPRIPGSFLFLGGVVLVGRVGVLAAGDHVGFAVEGLLEVEL
jgi:hypothetical protein